MQAEFGGGVGKCIPETLGHVVQNHSTGLSNAMILWRIDHRVEYISESINYQDRDITLFA